MGRLAVHDRGGAASGSPQADAEPDLPDHVDAIRPPAPPDHPRHPPRRLLPGRLEGEGVRPHRRHHRRRLPPRRHGRDGRRRGRRHGGALRRPGARVRMTRATGPFPFPAIPIPVRHFVALTAVAIAFIASRTTPSVIDDGGLYLLMAITVLGAAWFAGTGSALAVTVLGAALAGSAAPAGLH